MTKFERLFSQLPESIDCVLITSDINRRYFTGMKSSDGTVIAFRDKAYLIIDFRYIEKARATVTEAEVIEQKKLYAQLAELIRDHKAANMAIEAQTLTVSRLHTLRAQLRDVEVIDTDVLSNAINSLRSVKDEYELGCIKKAQEIAEKALADVLGFIRDGVTERQIALELNRLMFDYGAEDLSFETIVLSGANTSMPHGVPSDKKVQRGEFVLMDFGAVYEGYHSDMTRTVCVGEPDGEMRKVYEIVLEAQTAAINAAHAGMTGHGSCFGHSLGHGVGLEIHERPNASPNFMQPLNEGAVVTVEPGIYIAGKFGVRIEDFVILTENGCINLTKSAKNI
ncbi:MAG: aminopeptidase P family protein, partial [Ruminococcus sp.]|nr:aminopeptidase P family protein [Ruminococcus sp.]